MGFVRGAVRRIKEGTSAVLLQSSLDEKCWDDSMECFCYLRNIQDLLSDGQTPYDDSANHSKDPWFRLARWSNITLFLRKTYRDCISSARKGERI